jgi:hypothetical protein
MRKIVVQEEGDQVKILMKQIRHLCIVGNEDYYLNHYGG